MTGYIIVMDNGASIPINYEDYKAINKRMQDGPPNWLFIKSNPNKDGSSVTLSKVTAILKNTDEDVKSVDSQKSTRSYTVAKCINCSFCHDELDGNGHYCGFNASIHIDDISQIPSTCPMIKLANRGEKI